ncbi:MULTISPECIES: LPS export ABC transporter periplasmic protein LptC [unclassified Duganella]|uniref:LPS export ABC transporter periplasmic protein LptC n=1 Tax=unclassified Duganella TaxID=2636909 RepID=UPI000E3558CF|nr:MULTISPECIES: LPS export ABC transporter periplasmic protein LptC [unclassified Duganella]RFP10119.1 LPS export ABC transporter periplasmic protein LptC [Duganella sp. BJB475]RFP25575.1 LPS export ABC transporter periplasmic protein LptC [Duganella sp. BJB476]
MRKKTAHRWQLTVIMLVGVFVAVGSFWLVQVVNQAGQQERTDQHRNEPDYIIDRFSMVRMNKAGQPAYIVSGDKLTHRPIDDSSDIDKPHVQSLSGDQPPMNIHADTAHVDQGNTRVKLNGNVDVVRPASPKAQAMRMTAPTLTVFPDEQRMETDAPVELHLGTTVANGNGMKANNATLQVQLGGRGTITMPPHAAK